MKTLISIIAMAILSGCSAMVPDMFKTIDDIATDDAITVQVDRDAIKKDTDVHIIVDVVNKDAKDQPAK
jgi:hypothetical protein